MGFGRRKPQPDSVTSQPHFAGRATQLGEYIKNFELAHDDPDVRPIVNISGIGGVGKTFLLERFLEYAPQRTIWAKVDNPDEIGDSVVNLMRAISRRMGHQGQHSPLKRLDKVCDKWEELARKAEARKSDVPAQVFEILYGAIRLGVEKVTTATVAEAMDRALPREPAVALADMAADKLASLFQSREDRELMRDPKPVLTHALVQDLNDLTKRGHQIILVFDNYEALAGAVNPWLLDYLLDLERDNIRGDLRLIIVGRDELVRTHRGWRDVWQGHICHFPLEVFTEDEAREFLEKSCGITDPGDVAKICRMTDRLPLWLNLWRLAGASVESYDAALDLKEIAGRIMQWFTDPQERDWVEKAALCRWFDQPTLAALLQDEAQARAAYDWLSSHRTILSQAGDNFKLHEVIRHVLSCYLDQRDPDTKRRLEDRLAEHAGARLDAIAAREPDLSPRYQRDDWRGAVLDHLYYAWPGARGLPLLQAYFAEAQGHALDFLPAMLSVVDDADRAASRRAADWVKWAGQALARWAAGAPTALISVLKDVAAGRQLKPEQRALVHLRLGNLYSDLQDIQRPQHLEQAIAAYQAALEVYTRADLPLDWAMTQNNLGLAFSERIRGDRADNLEQAIAAYTHVLEIYPENDGVFYRRAGVYYDLERYQEALDDLQTTDRLQPNNPWILNYLGNAYAALDQHDRAREAYTAAIAHAPDDESKAMYYRNRVGAQLELGQLEEAQHDCEQALALAPDNPYTHERFGDLYLALKAYEQAVDSYRQAIAGEPSAPRYFGLGLALLAFGQPEGAKAAYLAGLETASPAEIKEALAALQEFGAAAAPTRELLSAALLGAAETQLVRPTESG